MAAVLVVLFDASTYFAGFPHLQKVILMLYFPMKELSHFFTHNRYVDMYLFSEMPKQPYVSSRFFFLYF